MKLFDLAEAFNYRLDLHSSSEDFELIESHIFLFNQGLADLSLDDLNFTIEIDLESAFHLCLIIQT